MKRAATTPLALALNQLNITNYAFAQALGVHVEDVSRWVRGRTTPRQATQQKIVEALNSQARGLLLGWTEAELFPSSQPACLLPLDQARWQAQLVEYAERVGRVRHPAHPLRALQDLEAQVARKVAQMQAMPPGSLERWNKAGSLVYYAAQLAARGQPERLHEAEQQIVQAGLAWERAITIALQKYALRAEGAERAAERERAILTTLVTGDGAAPRASERMPAKSQC